MVCKDVCHIVFGLLSTQGPSGKTFCSRYIAEALKQSGRPEFSSLEPLCTTPSGLHGVLFSTNKVFIDVSEARMKRLNN